MRDVVLTETARQQLDAAADWYAGQNSEVAAAWFNGLIERLESLCHDPGRHPVARESTHLPVELREMLYGSGRRVTHRVLFVVRPTTVVVYQIRHVAMRDVTVEDL